MSDKAVYRLAGAILLQAVQDAISCSVGRRASAWRWMSNHEEYCYSFSSICRILNRNPDEVRRFCESRALERRIPKLPFRDSLN